MSNRLANIIAASFLIFVFLICLFSIRDDSLTMDELAHLPAGYSYLTQQDMRLNPEHPPLIKDMAAFPLLFFKNLKFPSGIDAWQKDINGQWNFGNNFLFKSGNPADQMIFWSRIPMIFVSILLGFYVFLFGKTFFNAKTGLLALFLCSLSPTLLAHGRLVTTDMGVAAGVLIATYYFLKVLEQPNKKNIFLAGICFGLAQLTKFTAIFLVPFFGFLTLIWLFLAIRQIQTGRIKLLLRYCLILLIIFTIGFLAVWIVYYYHVIRYPVEKQVQDTKFLLSSHPIGFLSTLLSNLAKNKILRPFAQYLLGLFLVFQRGIGGNTTYFLGEVSAVGWRTYFPVVYLIKEPLAFHFLTIIAILTATYSIKKPFWQESLKRIKDWVWSHLAEFSLIVFSVLYLSITLIGNLNLGIRHLIPVLPLIMLLASNSIVKWLRPPHLKAKYLLLTILILWQIISVCSVYPYFIAYFNELIGGPDNGYLYVVDSNLDWGQDLKRLRDWTDKNNVDRIYIDYFGGADINYYLESKALQWQSANNKEQMIDSNYLAVSATLLMNGQGKPAHGFDQSTDHYFWLKEQELITTIGHSIFIYRID